MLVEAQRWGFQIKTVLTDDEALLRQWEGTAAHVVLIDSSLLIYAADTQTPQSLIFTCAMPDELEEIPGGRLLVLDGVQDPGNVGTIVRTADAFGADGVVLLPGCADLWSPKVVRATMGACFRLPVISCTEEKLTAMLKKENIPLYATALREDTEDLRDVSLKRAAVVIGSEGRGVSARVLNMCEKTLKIPMRERCESLNAAMAAGIVLWEGFK